MPKKPEIEGNRPKSAIVARLTLLLLAITALAVREAHAAIEVGPGRFSSIVIDASSGRVLSETNPDLERYPASLTKMMTLYLAFEALRDRRIGPDELVPISSHASSQAPSKLGLVPGSRITVQQAMLGLVTKSANDAACALGELMGGGSEAQFAVMMTMRAHALGMSRTVFRNASGLPDPDQVTTATDMALLARHLVRDFPDQYRLFSTPSFFWHGQLIANHDHLLKSYPGADGIKTGYTDAAGHNLVTSAVRANVRLIGVVLGAASNPERDARMITQLDNGYSSLNIPPPTPAVMMAAREPTQTRHHFPSLIASAEAATLPQPPVPPVRSGGANWSIQVGSFFNRGTAERVAFIAARATEGDARVARSIVRGKTLYRAQVAGLRETEATVYCRHHLTCNVIRPLDRLASR